MKKIKEMRKKNKLNKLKKNYLKFYQCPESDVLVRLDEKLTQKNTFPKKFIKQTTTGLLILCLASSLISTVLRIEVSSNQKDFKDHTTEDLYPSQEEEGDDDKEQEEELEKTQQATQQIIDLLNESMADGTAIKQIENITTNQMSTESVQSNPERNQGIVLNIFVKNNLDENVCIRYMINSNDNFDKLFANLENMTDLEVAKNFKPYLDSLYFFSSSKMTDIQKQITEEFENDVYVGDYYDFFEANGEAKIILPIYNLKSNTCKTFKINQNAMFDYASVEEAFVEYLEGKNTLFEEIDEYTSNHATESIKELMNLNLNSEKNDEIKTTNQAFQEEVMKNLKEEKEEEFLR